MSLTELNFSLYLRGLLTGIGFLIGFSVSHLPAGETGGMQWIQVSDSGTHFIQKNSGVKFIPWGVNYDHNDRGELLEDYWINDWESVVQDFQEIKQLGCNVVRIHLQVARFMKSAEQPHLVQLNQLKKLLQLAEETKLYLNLTGLGCYHKQDVPAWYTNLSESARWNVQSRFWRAIADVCKQSPAVFCYDLMNEPIIPGKKIETDWLAGELSGKYFVQRLSLDLKGRTKKEVAKAWVSQQASAIRKVDKVHLLTVGVIPWALSFPGAKPLFYEPQVSQPLDFVSVHFYPRKGQIDKALTALKVYEIGKPIVIEEMFPLKCSQQEMETFIRKSSSFTDGWISFYWGKTIAEYEKDQDIKGAIIANWLKYLKQNAPADNQKR